IRQTFTDTFQQFLAGNPEVSTFLGDYSRDGDWSDPSAAGIARGRALLEQAQARFAAIDMSDAILQDKDDVELATAAFIQQGRQLDDAAAGKDPGGPALTVVGVVFTMVLNKESQPDSLWWDHLISRLEKAPAYLDAARPTIVNPGRLQGQVASEQLAQAAGLF